MLNCIMTNIMNIWRNDLLFTVTVLDMHILQRKAKIDGETTYKNKIKYLPFPYQTSFWNMSFMNYKFYGFTLRKVCYINISICFLAANSNLNKNYIFITTFPLNIYYVIYFLFNNNEYKWNFKIIIIIMKIIMITILCGSQSF